MSVDLTFGQEFGPFIVAVVVGLLVSGALVLIGNRAGAAYTKAMASSAEHFRGMSKKRRRTKRASYTQSIQELREKAEGAHKVQLVGLYCGTAYLSYHLARLIIGEAGVMGAGKWVVVAAVMIAALVVVAFYERRAAQARLARLDAATDLDPEETTTS